VVLWWDRKNQGHSRCGTIKIPPCSKALSAEHRPKFLQPFTSNGDISKNWKIVCTEVTYWVLFYLMFILYFILFLVVNKLYLDKKYKYVQCVYPYAWKLSNGTQNNKSLINSLKFVVKYFWDKVNINCKFLDSCPPRSQNWQKVIHFKKKNLFSPLPTN
jgi:hypothetical protein